MEAQRISRKPIAASSSSPCSISELSSHDARGMTSIPTDPAAINHAPLSERNPEGSDPKDHLITENSDRAESAGQERYVRWEIAWITPMLMVLWALAGLGLALGHHFYYYSLDRTIPGSSTRQNFALRFGTAFSFLTITCLRVSCAIVYKQYIWTLFKRKSFSLRTVDRLFAATQDPLALFSVEFLRQAKVAYLIALACWCMALAGLAPPATLSVVSGSMNHTGKVSWPSLDWNTTRFYDMESHAAQPSPEVLRIATLAAESMAVILPTPPAPNSSFNLLFFGPSMQCSLADSSQNSLLENLADAMANESVMKVTKSLFESSKLRWGEQGIPGGIAPLMNVYSAFSPSSGRMGWLREFGDYVIFPVDAFNNWTPNNTLEFQLRSNSDDVLADHWEIVQQLWIQTADQGIVCTFGNASFNVLFEFVNAVQTKVEYVITDFTMYKVRDVGYQVTPYHQYSPGVIAGLNSYMAMYLALSGLLNGNISTTLTNGEDHGNSQRITFDGNVSVYEGTSKILQHGLSACDEIVAGYWTRDNAIGIGEDGPVLWQQAGAALEGYGNPNSSSNAGGGPIEGFNIDPSAKFSKISNNLFTKPA
ncbi:unnamed protein product [Periconia digitata]|uniref:Uncharacterized protein n=1 Tax=Periconia digitata TaxID=1303443 RepID=A0A9W4U6Y9_9PLEO|nr:unnamed protein product [Periconia digitata]